VIFRLAAIGVVLVCFFSCSEIPSELTDSPFKVRVPGDFPKMVIPEENQITSLRVELGRRLFYDTRLSADNTMSCGTCHVPSAAFTDGQIVNTGLDKKPLKRNTPTIANVAFSPYFMMEGGVPNLELQGLAPLHNSMEMGSDIMLAVDKLNEDERMRKLSKAAYGRDSIDPYVITRSLACFERTLISGDSRYDRHQQGLKDQLAEEELIGLQLFNSEKTGCNSCHGGELFTDFGIYNIGLDDYSSDPGLERKTHKPEDNGKFKTPTLRNIELTAPYMHDGRFQSLEEVVDFFNEGGKAHPSKDPGVHSLQLTQEEKAALVAFLKTLTDYNFVQNTSFLPLESQ
jgi:cytochrome c peroxidase